MIIMVIIMTDNIIIPALYSVNSAQPDSRQINITINAIYDGACYDKCLFSCDSIENSKESFQNVSISAEDDSCAVGTIPEMASCCWTTLLIDGKWRNYLQIDAILWAKMESKLPVFQENSSKFYEIELILSEINADLQENGLKSVNSFKLESFRLASTQATEQAAAYTHSNRYGSLPQR